MKILRKMIALVMVTIMAAMLFASCKPADETQTTPGASGTQEQSNDPNAPAKPEKLTIWLQKTFSDEFNNAFAQLFQDFGKENGIAISTEIVDAAALRDTKLPAALEAKNYPNIAYMEPASLMAYAKQGVLCSAEDTIAELEANGTKIMDNILATTYVDGVPYAVPFSAQSWMLWYRKDLLKEAGYDKAPETWDELLEMAKATTDASKGIYGAGFAAGASASDFNNMSQSILWSYGGSVMKDGKLNLDSEESKAALKQLIKFFEEGTVAPDMISGDDMANNTAMLAGTACFVVNIPTLASALQSDAPEIWENVGACPLPAGPEGSFPLAASNSMSILDCGEEANYWASKALAYATDKSRLASVLEMVAPAYGMIYADTLEMEEYMSDPIVKAHMEAIATGKYYNYPDPEFTAERAALTASSTFINNIIAYVVVDGMSFDDALAKEIEQCNQALANIK